MKIKSYLSRNESTFFLKKPIRSFSSIKFLSKKRLYMLKSTAFGIRYKLSSISIVIESKLSSLFKAVINDDSIVASF